MKAKFFLVVMVTIICIILIMPEIIWSQIPVRVKRSNQLTRSAMQLFKDHKIDQARENLNQALRLNAKNVLAHELLALLYYQERNFEQANKQANLAKDLNKQAPLAHYVLGMINFQQGNHNLARMQLKQASESLKDAEYRQKAKNILNKIKMSSKEKRPINLETKIPISDEVSGEQALEIDYKPYIAVFQFEDANVRTEHTKLGHTLTEMLITALIQADRFNVMERVQLEKILKEQSLGQTGTIDTETAVEVGKLSGLEGVVMGSISHLKSSIEADARLIDVETGKALSAASASINNVDDMRGLANSLAKQLSAKAFLIAPEVDSTKIK